MSEKPKRIIRTDCSYWVEIMEEEEENIKTKDKSNTIRTQNFWNARLEFLKCKNLVVLKNKMFMMEN